MRQSFQFGFSVAQGDTFFNRFSYDAHTESIEGFIEDQAFSRLYDLAPPPLPSARQATHRKIEKEKHLANGRRRGGVGEEPNHPSARKPGPL